MTIATDQLVVLRDAPIPTWFGVGGRADRLARPNSHEQVRACVKMDPDCRILGDGANLLVDDAGVGELVLDMKAMNTFTVDAPGARVVAQAGADLAKVIRAAVRAGLGGIEGLGGIPATVGGAVMMNAGGAFGEIGDAVEQVRGLNRRAENVALDAPSIAFGYRRSGLGGLIITEVTLRLNPGDPISLRARLKETIAYKKRSQPLRDNSAGCVFKNPVLAADVNGLGRKGQRISAGLIIDRAGCKGLRIGSAMISDRHANFIVVDKAGSEWPDGAGTGCPPSGGRARDVIELMGAVQQRVHQCFGLRLEPELVVWRRPR